MRHARILQMFYCAYNTIYILYNRSTAPLNHGIDFAVRGISGITEVSPDADDWLPLGIGTADFPSGAIVNLGTIKKGYHNVAIVNGSPVSFHDFLGCFSSPGTYFLLTEEVARPLHVMACCGEFLCKISMPEDFGFSEEWASLVYAHLPSGILKKQHSLDGHHEELRLRR